MVSFKFDQKGAWKIKFPGNDIEIIETARSVVKAEADLPDTACFPRLNLLRHTLSAAEKVLGVVALDNESAVMDETAAFKRAEDFLQVLIAGLTYFHAHEISRLKEWGLDVVDGKPQSPSGKEAVTDLLASYVAKEQSLAVDDRLPSPPLAQVAAVSRALVNARARREQEKETKSSRERPAEVTELYELLQLVAAFHLVINCEGTVDARLARRGFEIVEIPVRKPKPRNPDHNTLNASESEQSNGQTAEQDETEDSADED